MPLPEPITVKVCGVQTTSNEQWRRISISAPAGSWWITVTRQEWDGPHWPPRIGDRVVVIPPRFGHFVAQGDGPTPGSGQHGAETETEVETAAPPLKAAEMVRDGLADVAVALGKVADALSDAAVQSERLATTAENARQTWKSLVNEQRPSRYQL